MTRAAKALEKMRRNPRDWRIEDLVGMASQFGIHVRNDGGSHHVFSAPGLRQSLSVPARRPILPVYVRNFLALVDSVIADQEGKP